MNYRGLSELPFKLLSFNADPKYLTTSCSLSVNGNLSRFRNISLCRNCEPLQLQRREWREWQEQRQRRRQL
jgi:hypothetical protein